MVIPPLGWWRLFCTPLGSRTSLTLEVFKVNEEPSASAESKIHLRTWGRESSAERKGDWEVAPPSSGTFHGGESTKGVGCGKGEGKKERNTLLLFEKLHLSQRSGYYFTWERRERGSAWDSRRRQVQLAKQRNHGGLFTFGSARAARTAGPEPPRPPRSRPSCPRALAGLESSCLLCVAETNIALHYLHPCIQVYLLWCLEETSMCHISSGSTMKAIFLPLKQIN
ncbi:uncharacterized protein LOC128773408 [Panthera pardus]|uniref:Uncharacterized protein LOC128773408 n=1 Tax=Panthera pardus TaxID=9691 RepID=A0A9W2UHS3_PANPR|nr:uncharacterized protein LOC128773408 [Panthera pardus]